MGPIALFDKSFLQSLNLSEAVLFDNFFLTNIAPLFFVETLADLEKDVSEGRTPEKVVGNIASKTPELHSSPNFFHGELCVSNLMGYVVEMDGRVVKAGGRPVKSEGQSGIVYDYPPEAEAFARWQNKDFLEVERKFAKAWRLMISVMSFDEGISILETAGLKIDSCKSLDEAKNVARSLVMANGDKFNKMKLALSLLSIPENIHKKIFSRWKSEGFRPLAEFAPYAAYVFTVDAFFYIAVASKLISTEKVTNKIDLAYLYYLPFCMIFISTDRFHERCASLFLRDNQEFVWGGDLKGDLKKLDLLYDKLPKEKKEKGIYSFAAEPPNDDSYLVTRLWDRCMPGWRDTQSIVPDSNQVKNSKLANYVTKMAEAKTLEPNEIDFDISNPDSVTLKRKISKRKGKWWLLPKDLESKTKN